MTPANPTFQVSDSRNYPNRHLLVILFCQTAKASTIHFLTHQASLTKTLDSIGENKTSKDINDILEGPGSELVIPLFLPISVISRCDELIRQAMGDLHLVPSNLPLQRATRNHADLRTHAEDTLVPVFWVVDPISCWQRLDPRIDEYVRHVSDSQGRCNVVTFLFRTFEVLRAFSQCSDTNPQGLLDDLKSIFSKSFVIQDEYDEFVEFSRWVTGTKSTSDLLSLLSPGTYHKSLHSVISWCPNIIP